MSCKKKDNLISTRLGAASPQGEAYMERKDFIQMKKFIAITLAAGMSLCVLAGCGSSKAEETSEAENQDILAQIQAKGYITIGMEGNWSPWTYHDDDDELVGYDVEVGRAIAEKLGVEAQFIEGEWDGLFAGVNSGRYDIICNGVDVTDEREESYTFSDPYAYTYTALVVRSDNEDITSFDDLEGKTTTNSIGSTYMELAESYGAEVLGVDTLDETIQMVLQGRADATLNAVDSFGDYLNQHPDAEIKIVALTEDANPVAIPMKKGDDTATLQEAINAALAELKEDGTLAELSMKYFGSDITK